MDLKKKTPKNGPFRQLISASPLFGIGDQTPFRQKVPDGFFDRVFPARSWDMPLDASCFFE